MQTMKTSAKPVHITDDEDFDISTWEKWVPSVHPDYKVSNYGRVMQWRKRLVLKQSTNKDGYKCVRLAGQTYRVHRLVAMAFIPNPENKPQVNHIDGNKQNNNLNNLEWVTNQENVQHAFKIGLEKAHYGEEHGMAKLTNEDVLTIRKLYAGGITDFNNKYSQRELAKMYGVKQSTIWGILHRKNWSHI